MTRPSLQIVFALLFLVLATPSFADEPIAQKKKGTGSITTRIEAGKSSSITFDGSTFRFVTLSISGPRIQYSLKRGGKVLSSGAGGGGKVQIKSDGSSTYKLRLKNTSSNAAEVTVSVVEDADGRAIWW